MAELGRCINKTLVFTATLNERDNILGLCQAVLSLSPHYDFLVIDDNSPDGTGEVLDKFSKFEERVKVLHRPSRLGLGTAHKLAMVYAVKHGYDTLVTMDADWSHDPKDIPRLIENLSDADFVIGSRYMKGGKCDYHGTRRFLSIGANIGARLLLGVPLHEYTTSFRAFRVEILRRLNLFDMRARGYSYFLEVATRIYRAGARVKEVPIHFSDRKAGTSKIPPYEVFRGIYRLLTLSATRLLFRTTTQPPPDLKNLKCYLCSSPYLVEAHQERTYDRSNPDTVRCTTMTHRPNPQVVACLACGLDFAPQRGHVTDLYSNVMDKDYIEFKEARYKTFSVAFERIASYLKEGSRLLEVGCYCGYFLDVARKHNMRVDGIDPSAWAVRHAREKLQLNVHHGTLLDADDKIGSSYEAVVMWDVLEHLEDPLSTLKQIHSRLEENGYLFLSTLDIDNWFPKLTGKHWPWLMPMHVFYFRTPALQYLLKKAGFELVKSRTYSHYISLNYFLKKVIALAPEIFQKPLSLLDPLLPKNGPFIPFQFGDIKLYVFRKSVSAEAPDSVPGLEGLPFAVENMTERPSSIPTTH